MEKKKKNGDGKRIVAVSCVNSLEGRDVAQYM